jgi:hypothetical protein
MLELLKDILCVFSYCIYDVTYGFVSLVCEAPSPTKKKQNINTDPQHQKPKWAVFTYSGKETRRITKLLKDTKIKIAFRMRNTKQYIVRQHPQKDRYNDSGICQMKCLDCPLKYIGQTSRTFHIR